jgi:hypothetical protein
MSASRALSSSLLIATCLFVFSSASGQGIPPEAYHAKTVFIRNNAGGAPLENAADEELNKWGRFTLADGQASADIILVFSKNGVQNTEEREQAGRHMLPDQLRRQLFARRHGACVSEGTWAGAGIAALLAERLWGNDAEGHRQRLHRSLQKAVSQMTSQQQGVAACGSDVVTGGIVSPTIRSM